MSFITFAFSLMYHHGASTLTCKYLRKISYRMEWLDKRIGKRPESSKDSLQRRK
jgi:hypothetical protein